MYRSCMFTRVSQQERRQVHLLFQQPKQVNPTSFLATCAGVALRTERARTSIQGASRLRIHAAGVHRALRA